MEINIKPWVWNWLGILLVIFLGVSILAKIPDLKSAFKSTLPEKTISMSAEGKVSGVPDLATINLGVVSSAPTAAKAQSDNSTKINAVIDFIKKQGVDDKDIATTQLNVYPQYDYTSGRNTVTGYQATQTLSVKIRGIDKSSEMVGRIIDGSTTAGANEVNGVSLSFDDPDDLKQQARKLAIENAKTKAQELADQTGLKLGKIVNISESSGGYPMPVPYMMDSAVGIGGAEKSVPANIQPGSQDVIANVTVIFELK